MPKFKGVADLVDTIQISPSFSPDAQAVTVIFRNVTAAVGGDAQTAPLVATKVVSVRIPVLENTDGVTVAQDVRGFADLRGQARSVLLMQAAGQTTEIDLAAITKDNNFVQRSESQLPAGEEYLVTFFLLVERGAATAEDQALITVDSLDVEFSATLNPSAKR